MKTALILGCSHAAGSEMWRDPTMPRDENGEIFDCGVTRSYPVKIATALGFQTVINSSIPGGSNDSMFRIFKETETGPEDLVVACWTGFNRTEIFDNNKWTAIAPGKEDIEDLYKDYVKQWLTFGTSDRSGRLNKLKNILALNALAATRGTKVINIDSFWPVPDFEKYGYWPVDVTFCDWSLDQGYPATKGGHFFENVHQAFAEYVLQSIQPNLFDAE